MSKTLGIEHITPYISYTPIVTCGEMAGFPLEYPVIGVTTFAIYTYSNGEDSKDGFIWMAFERFPFRLMLRPLSDLNKVIKYNDSEFVPMEMLRSMCSCEAETEFIDGLEDLNSKDWPARVIYAPATLFAFLVGWHFDVFGLIERGIAVPKR